MLQHSLLIILTVVIGMTLSLQPPINAVIARTFDSALFASMVSIGISFIIVVVLWSIWGNGLFSTEHVKALPWWVVFGGVIGVVVVAGSIAIAPRIGLTIFFVSIVAGQLISAVVMDHVGAFGVPEKPINLYKILGLVLVVIGAAIVQFKE